MKCKESSVNRVKGEMCEIKKEGESEKRGMYDIGRQTNIAYRTSSNEAVNYIRSTSTILRDFSYINKLMNIRTN